MQHTRLLHMTSSSSLSSLLWLRVNRPLIDLVFKFWKTGISSQYGKQESLKDGH